MKSLTQARRIYLQDNFSPFGTISCNSMRLDGHGRLKGNVVDTSGNGQTLFFEPEEVVELTEVFSHLN